MDERTEHLRAHLPDRYEIVREHGRGGMAVVYLAIDRKHDREVALKVLAPELTAGIGAERFVREIQIAAHLNHPHILPLLDSGVADGLPYYVMPFVEGESLRERLARGEPVSVRDAVRIARDVAEALVYAHDHELIHRDIKPGNILLTEGGAVVTDFGIAAAVDQLPEDHLTRTGLSVGSAGYMSPEQATGERDLDGRADQYSLACVLFEMLAGHPPFTGRNARAILSRQLTEPPPAVSGLRDGVPEELDEVVGRALALEPEDRFATTREFEAALEALAHRTATGAALRFRTRPAIWAALAAAVALAGVSWFMPLGRPSTDPQFHGDTTTYAIFPFRYDAAVDIPLRETLRLRAGLARWEGLSPVDDFQLREAMERTGADSLTSDEAARVALEKNAGRFFMGQVLPIGDSISVHAVLYQIDSDGRPYPMATDDIRLSRSLAEADSLFTQLATSLLWHGSPPEQSPDAINTHSLGAWQAFDYGMAMLQDWELPRADSGFRAAVTLDEDYPEGYLWLALVRAWAGVDPSRWQLAAEQAAMRADRLTKRDAAMAEALVLQSRGNYGDACQLWDALTPLYPDDFAVWYGLAVCLNTDHVVVGDEGSPTGWAFRSSRQRAIEAYREAFSKLPSILESFRAGSYLSLRQLLMVEPSVVTPGHSETDSAPFAAYPTWAGDTLAFWMRPRSLINSPATPDEHQKRRLALQNQRRVFREVAGNWASHAPRSGGAREALAVALAMSGDRAALDTLQAARELTEDPATSLRLAGRLVWLRIAFGLPDEPGLLDEARSLADSVLSGDSAGDPEIMVALCMLTGRALRAARTWRDNVPAGLSPEPAVAFEAVRLLAFSAMGGPADSLDRAERDLLDKTENALSSEAREGVYRWLGLPASLAYSTHPLASRERIPNDYLVDAQLAFARGDTAAVREALDETRALRGEPNAATLDALYAEAALWRAIGEPDRAAAWLAPMMSELATIAEPLSNPERLATLIRASALRAESALATGDALAASRWAGAVTILWSDADPFLQPLVERMRRIAKCESC